MRRIRSYDSNPEILHSLQELQIPPEMTKLRKKRESLHYPLEHFKVKRWEGGLTLSMLSASGSSLIRRLLETADMICSADCLC